jgi:hypothetical protein
MTYALMTEFALSGAVVWSLICRARLMDHETRFGVRIQHGALMAAAVFSPFVGEFSTLLWGAGIASFLILERRSPVRQEVARSDLEYVHILPRDFRGVPR